VPAPSDDASAAPPAVPEVRAANVEPCFAHANLFACMCVCLCVCVCVCVCVVLRDVRPLLLMGIRCPSLMPQLLLPRHLVELNCPRQGRNQRLPELLRPKSMYVMKINLYRSVVG